MNTKVKTLMCVWAVTLLAAFNACDDGMPKNVEFPDYMSVYLIQANNSETVTVNLMGELDTVMVFPGIRYGGTSNPVGVITASVVYDESLISAYNELNGTSYIPAPAGVVSIETPTLTIPGNDFASNLLNVRVNDQGLLEAGASYLVPVSVTSVSGLPLKEGASTFYVILKRTLTRQELIDDMNAHIKGQWTFDNASDPFKATVGADLTPMEYGGAITSTTVSGSNLGVFKPADSYLWVDHNIGANGDGNRVNEYTLMMDFSVPQTSISWWCTLYQTNINNDDYGTLWVDSSAKIADYWWNEGSGASVTADKWHRLIVVASLSEWSYKVYLDNIELSFSDGSDSYDPDGLYSLDPVSVLIGADGYGYGLDMSLGELRIWDKPLNSAQIDLLKAEQ